MIDPAVQAGASPSDRGQFDAAIRSRSARIGVVGLGYAGLTLALSFARAGFQVAGIDIAPDRAAAVNEGRSYIVDVTDDDLAAVAGRLSADHRCGHLAGCAAVVICVQTGLAADGAPDLSHVTSAVEDVARQLSGGELVVLESTTVPSTTSDIVVPAIERLAGGRVGRDFFVGYAPERIDPGNRAGWTLESIPRLVSGVTSECLRRAVLLFQQVCRTVVPVRSPAVAEVAKAYENTFRLVNIALANELALMCGHLGISAWDVIEAAATKPFGFLPHYPGPGVGGDCIPVAPQFLAHPLAERGHRSLLVEAAQRVNAAMPAHVAGRVRHALAHAGVDVEGARVLLLGMSYKPEIGDVRRSPAVEVCAELQRLGADVGYVDPFVPSVRIGRRVLRSLPWDRASVAAADCVVVLVRHSLFTRAPLWDHARSIVDTQHVVPARPNAFEL